MDERSRIDLNSFSDILAQSERGVDVKKKYRASSEVGNRSPKEEGEISLVRATHTGNSDDFRYGAVRCIYNSSAEKEKKKRFRIDINIFLQEHSSDYLLCKTGQREFRKNSVSLV